MRRARATRDAFARDASSRGCRDAPRARDVAGVVESPYVVRFNFNRDDRGAALAIGDERGRATIARARDSARDDGRRSATAIAAHENAVYDVAWTRDDARVLTASADRAVAMFDAETGRMLAKMMGHGASVKAVATAPTQREVFASGGRDGRLILSDARTRRGAANEAEDADAGEVTPTRTVRRAHRAPGAGTRASAALHSVTSVAFDGSGSVVLSSGGSDGLVKMWDARKMKGAIGVLEDEREDAFVRGSFYDVGLGARFGGEGARATRASRGISGIAVDPTSSRVVVSYLDDHMAMFDANDPRGKPLRHFVGHRSRSYYIKPTFSPDGDRVACGSLDNDVHVWDVRDASAPSVALDGHTASVSCVHWSPTDPHALASCCDDGEIRLWRFDGARKPSVRARVDSRAKRPAPPLHPNILRALGRAPTFDDSASADHDIAIPGAFAPASPSAPTRVLAADVPPAKRRERVEPSPRRPFRDVANVRGRRALS